MVLFDNRYKKQKPLFIAFYLYKQVHYVSSASCNLVIMVLKCSNTKIRKYDGAHLELFFPGRIKNVLRRGKKHAHNYVAQFTLRGFTTMLTHKTMLL